MAGPVFFVLVRGFCLPAVNSSATACLLVLQYAIQKFLQKRFSSITGMSLKNEKKHVF